MTRRCGHGRQGAAVRTCPGCLLRISPADYWALIRALRKPRRTKDKQ